MKKLIFIALLISTTLCFGQGDKLRVKGFVDTYHAVRIENPNDFLASRSRFRGEIEKVNGKSYFFASINAVQNNAMPELSKIDFREAYLEYTDSNWGFKAGRQIIIWGKADGLKITDIISPMDLTEFLAQDYDDIRMPVNAITFSRFENNWELELLCVPVFESYILPGKGNPWGINYSSLGEGIKIDKGNKPAKTFKNMEYGGKLSFYLRGVDFEISALNTWNKMPIYSYYENDSTGDFHLKPEYNRLGFVGLGFSKSLGEFILRGESALHFDKTFSPKIEDYQFGLINKNSMNYLLGIDWYPGNEWTITGQFSDEFIFDYLSEIENNKHTYLSTLGVSKKALRSTLSISSFAYIGLNDGDLFNRTSIDYALSDNIHVLTGLDWFHGDEGLFGQYKNNSEIWFKAKYSF